MGDDYEDFYDIDSLSDPELEALVREELDEYPDLDASGLDITVTDGRVTLAGRVGTEAEYQQIEHVLTDVIGVRVENEMLIDELRRQEQPVAADEANAQVYGSGRGGRGGADRTDDAAEHLLADPGAGQFGTNDVGEAVERGYSYNPPDTPVQEGTWSKENH
jgi:hypothetical protein